MLGARDPLGARDAGATGRRWRRRRALLASGLVLGVGAATTLAAWNDAEHSQATLSAGTFSIVGSTDGASFSEHASGASAARLEFAVPPTAMAPGGTAHALFSVRTGAGSVAGTVAVVADVGNATGLGAHLRYGVRAIAGTVCDASTYAVGSALVPTGSPLTAGSAASRPLAAEGAGAANLCFAITLPTDAGNEAQGLVAAPRWRLVATSS